MTSEFIHGSARNSLVWLGVAKSTHRASERVRGSGRGMAWHGVARRGEAGQGAARQTHSGSRAVAVWHGLAWRGKAWRGVANTQRLTGRCSLRGNARRGRAESGKARQTHSGLRAVAVCSTGHGTARHGRARPGAARRGLARQTHSGLRAVAVWRSLARRGGARHGEAGRGKYTRLITGQFYDKQT